MGSMPKDVSKELKRPGLRSSQIKDDSSANDPSNDKAQLDYKSLHRMLDPMRDENSENFARERILQSSHETPRMKTPTHETPVEEIVGTDSLLRRCMELKWISIIIGIVAIISVYQICSETKHDFLEIQPFSKFLIEMEKVGGRFTKNSPESVKSVNSIKNTLSVYLRQSPPHQPYVLLLLGTKGESCKTCCFLWHIVKALTAFYDEEKPTTGHIKAENIPTKDAKNFLESTIESTINITKKHLIIMSDIDKFPVSSLSKLHGYFDNDNAPYKDVVFLLSAVTELRVEDSTSPMMLAQKHFDTVWSEYETDHRRALMGRMLSVTATVQPSDYDQENEDSCQTECALK